MPTLWSTKQRQGHPLHHICPYQGSFPPQLPAYFLDKYPGSKVVLDPFCGRGTTLLEAALRGKVAIGFDTSPVAVALSSAKLYCGTLDELLEDIDCLDLSGKAPEPPEDIKPFYHPETWRELYRLREDLLREPHRTITALALGRLHGHSPGFFSCFTFNVVSVHGDSLRKAQKKHGTRAEYRNVKELLKRAAKRFVPKERHNGKGYVVCGDVADSYYRTGPSQPADLVITSPPFLDVIDYYDANWLRMWFLRAKPTPGPVKDPDEYVRWLRDRLVATRRQMTPDGTLVLEVGPIRRKVRLLDLVRRASSGVFREEELLLNEFEGEDGGKTVPKISRAMVGGRQTATMINQCLIMRPEHGL